MKISNEVLNATNVREVVDLVNEAPDQSDYVFTKEEYAAHYAIHCTKSNDEDMKDVYDAIGAHLDCLASYGADFNSSQAQNIALNIFDQIED